MAPASARMGLIIRSVGAVMASVLGVAKLKEIITPAPSSATWALVQLWAPHVLQLLWDGEGSDGDYGRNNFAQKACEQCKTRRKVMKERGWGWRELERVDGRGWVEGGWREELVEKGIQNARGGYVYI